MNMSTTEPLTRESLSELGAIIKWLKERGEDQENPITILIGGWAVYSYNKYLGSIDIDLITNSATRQSLMYYLRSNRGYKPEKFQGKTSVSKLTENGKIIIDFGSREILDKFEGKNFKFSFGILDGNVEIRDFDGTGVPVPTRSLLIFLKLKAIWDRKYRIENGSSHDLDWEKGKLVKDYADILALVDLEKGGDEVDFMFLGLKFKDFPFLKDGLKETGKNIEAMRKYGIDQEKAEEYINRLMNLL